jgi:hypothetical protein
MKYIYDTEVSDKKYTFYTRIIVNVTREENPNLSTFDILDLNMLSVDYDGIEMPDIDSLTEIARDLLEEKIESEMSEIFEYGKLTIANNFEEV